MDPTRTFIIDRCLGRGGFGEVYRATMTRSNGMERDVALKVLRRDIDPDGQAIRRLRDEGRLLATLRHPAILKVHDLALLDGRIALITEFVDGHDLTACMQGDGRMGPRALLTVLSHVVGAIVAAWETSPQTGGQPLRMVHRDIKPSNIRLSPHAVVKLLDFGIARTDAVDRESRTRTGMLVGSPAYMAPERFLEHGVLVESDIFSLGAVLFEGLTSERFYGTMPIPMQVGLAVAPERFAAHLQERLGLVEAVELRALCAEMLAYLPADRPPLADLGPRLDALADRTAGPSLERWCRNRDWPPMEVAAGELDGQTLTEGNLAPPRAGSLSSSLLPNTPVDEEVQLAVSPAPRSPPTVETLAHPRPSPLPTGLIVLLAVGSLVVAAVSVAAGIGSGTLVYALQGGPDDLPVAEPTPAPAPAPPIEAPRPDPVPSVPAPVSTAVPRPRAAPRPPPPGPAPSPLAPPVVEGARVDAVGADVVFAISAQGRVRLPAHLPEGSYTLEAAFNGGLVRSAGALTVTRDRPTTLRCSNRMLRCTAP